MSEEGEDELAGHEAAPCESPTLFQSSDERRKGGRQDDVTVEAETAGAHDAADPDKKRLHVIHAPQQAVCDGRSSAEQDHEDDRRLAALKKKDGQREPR